MKPGFFEARRSARALRHGALAPPLPAPEVVAVLAEDAGFSVTPLPPGDPLLMGAAAVLDRDAGSIWYVDEAEPGDRAVLVAHELGHHTLHRERRHPCGPDQVDATQSAHQAPIGAQRVTGYGPRERRELEANVFARELLLPRALAWELYVQRRATASEIAELLTIPLQVVYTQLADALLLPDDEGDPRIDHALPPLDSDQRTAAEVGTRHHLILAGPGSGKTRTLIARVSWLLDKGESPEDILVLTFSNRAAAEIGVRLTRGHGERASSLWSGTFHAFGLELLRRFHTQAGLSPSFRVFDATDAVELLEERLPTLGLNHYESLYEPAHALKRVLGAISRAKDEAVDADTYAQLARAWSNAPAKKKQRALEIAKIYREYELLLAHRDALDFGDLIVRPLRLLDHDEQVRAHVQGSYRHILVDEYQDTNSASARLLQRIAGNRTSVWAVGDPRQSVYRFRGACPENVRRFPTDFAGATVQALHRCYRSTPEIIAMLNTFAAAMPMALSVDTTISTDQPPSGHRTGLIVCPDDDAELDAIAAGIRTLVRRGVPLSEQAVLCRSNRRMADVARHLEHHGIQTLTFASIFEREEVRDLLSVLALIAGHGQDAALCRLASMPCYRIPWTDAISLARASSESGVSLLELVQSGSWEVTGEASDGLARLAADLRGAQATDPPWTVLARYLFEGSAVLRHDLEQRDMMSILRRIATYQLLSLARSPHASGRRGLPIVRFLDRVRRMVLLDDEGDLRRLPDSAQSLDAVRLMTIHAAKGLEFDAVHVPGLSTGGLPARRQWSGWPSVPGLKAHAEDPKEEHQTEEACLFYVAASRARIRLTFYRSERSPGGRRRSPSPHLGHVHGLLDHRHGAAPGGGTQQPTPALAAQTAGQLSPRALDAFKRCPRQYYYGYQLGLRGLGPRGVFGVVTRKIKELVEAVRASDLTSGEAEQEATSLWARSSLQRHAYAEGYRRILTDTARILIQHGVGKQAPDIEPLRMELQGRIVDVPADQILLEGSTIVVRRFRFSTRRLEPGETTWYAMAAEAIRAAAPGRSSRVENLYLLDGHVQATDAKRATLERAHELGRQIALSHFRPTADKRTCARCAFNRLCPAIPPNSD